MSTTRKQKIAGKLSGGLKSPDNRLAMADAVMADCKLLKPRGEPGKTPHVPAPVPGRGQRAAKTVKRTRATTQVDLLEIDAQEARERAIKADLAAFDPRKHGGEAMASTAVGVEFGAPGAATNVSV